jgi:hypothetical protein
LLASFQYFRESFASKPESAYEFLNQGDYPRDATLDTGELAAYAAVCSLILNLDEVVTKQ